MQKNGLWVLALMLWATGAQAANTLSPLPQKQLRTLKQYQTQVQAALKNSTPAQANQLLLQYIPKLQKMIETIERADKRFLDDEISNHVTSNSRGAIIKRSPALQARYRQMREYGLQYEYYDSVGKGYIRAHKNHLLQLFGDKVSPAVKAYLNIHAQQYDETLYYDQEMVMPYAKVGEQMMAWERYLQQYRKNNVLYRHAVCQYKIHQSSFLTGGYTEDSNGIGMGITGIVANFDETPEKLKPEVRKAWTNFQKKYPNSPTSALIAKMPKKPPYQAPADKILNHYHKQAGFSKITPEQCAKLWF